MPDMKPAPRGETLEILRTATQGVFPGPMLEALIARLEGAK